MTACMSRQKATLKSIGSTTPSSLNHTGGVVLPTSTPPYTNDLVPDDRLRGASEGEAEEDLVKHAVLAKTHTENTHR
jgi:hypothetical protein